jgi:tape measure domain-containing protein
VEAGTAWVTILPEVKNFGRDLNRQVTAEASKAGDDTGRSLGRSLGSSLIKTVGALGIGLGVGQVVGLGMRTAMDNEMAQIKFTQLLGSADQAKAYIKDLQDFAKRTPFDFPGLQDAASRFLAVGVNAEDVIPLLTRIGDATSIMGTGAQGIDRATTALAQMSGTGRVTAEDMQQLVDAGIPAWNALAGQLGVTEAKAREMVTAGLVPASDMFTALESNAGDKMQLMSGGMDKMSGTFAGQWSSLKDTATQTLGTLFVPVIAAGTLLIGFLNETLFPALGGFGDLLTRWKTPIMVVAGVIATLMLPTLIAWAIQAGVTAVAVVTSWATSGAAATAGVARQIGSILLLNVQYLRMGAQAMLGAVRVVAAWVLQKAPMLVTLALAIATFAVLIAQWVAIGIAAMVNALIVAAAWLVAFWPVALVIAAIIAVIAIFVIFWDEIKAILGKIWEFIKDIFGKVKDFVVGVWNWLWDTVKGIFTAWWSAVKAVFSAVWEFIKSVFAGIKDAVLTVWNALWNAVKTVWTTFSGWVTGAIDSVREFIVGAFEKVRDKVKAVWDKISSIVRNAVEGVVNIGKGIWDGLKGVINVGIDILNKGISGFNSIPLVPDIPKIPRLAQGGIVTRPTLAVIGEAGPEAVIPLSRTGGSTARGPLVAIENLTMSDPVDVDLLATRLGLLSTAGRL